MARPRTAKQNDILSRVTGLGQEALQKLTDVPGGSRVVEMLNESKTRIDEMQKKLRGLDELERRVAKLEKQLAATQKPAGRATTARTPSTATSSASKPAATKPTAARKPATPKKPPA